MYYLLSNVAALARLEAYMSVKSNTIENSKYLIRIQEYSIRWT